jgi:hypothetical protein
MARDRRFFRVFVVTTGLLWSSASTGCLRSPLVRQAGGPSTPTPIARDTQPPAMPSAGPAPLSVSPQVFDPNLDKTSMSPPAPSDPAAISGSATDEHAAPSALQTQAAEALRVPPAESAGSPPISSAPPVPEAPKTPLLDAAIERVTAVRSEQRHALAADALPDESDRSSTPSNPPVSPVVVPASAVDVKAPERAAAIAFSESGSVVVPAPVKPDDAPPATAPSPLPKEETARPLPEAVAKEDRTTANSDTVTAESRLNLALPTPVDDARSSVRAADDPEPFGIGKLRLCRKVNGFGSFESMEPYHVKAGQRILVYCEMTGMQYEAKDAAFVSRLSSKIEISSAAGGAVVWTRELGPAEDICGSRRHDYYVNYRVDVPQNLAPGAYRLRVTQSDLVAHRTTSADLSFDIAR